MEPIISLRGISKEYKHQDVPALSSLTLDIYPGQFLAITGASGSGKSTLLNILGLLTDPDQGSYQIKGQETSKLKGKELDQLRSQTFGFIFQSAHVLGYETVINNAMLGLRIQNQPLADRYQQASSWLKQIGLDRRHSALGSQLSGGERQRLAIARAMATNPDILLADEPTGNLDSQNASRVFEELKAINAQGTTVVLITHDPSLAAQAQRQVVLKDGQIISDTLAPAEEGKQPEEQAQEEKQAQSEKQAQAEEAEKTQQGQARAAQAAAKKTSPFLDDALDALNYISLTPFKALTLIFAFMLGIGGLVLAQGLSQTASHQVAQTIATAALDDVKVDFNLPSNSSSQPAALKPVIEKIEGYQGVQTVSLERTLATGDLKPSLLAYKESAFSGSIFAVDSSYFSYLEAQVTNPHSLWQLDQGRPVAFVGQEVAKDLGIGNPGSGNGVIWLAGQPVTVLGLVEGSSRDHTVAQNIYLNATYASSSPELTLAESGLRLVIRTEPGFPAPLAQALPLIIDPAAPENIRVSTVGDLRNIQRGVSSNLGSLVTGISWLLIGLAALTSATTLYTSVQGRRAEVALRRALGSSKGSILRIFLCEGTLLGLAGGVAGASLGLVGLVISCQILGWDPQVSMGFALLGLLLGALSGMLSAAYPAYLAAQAQPAEAIRS